MWAPHVHYFQKKGIFHDPRKAFCRQLITQLKHWQAKGDKIILFADLNENVYAGQLVKLLQGDDLLMCKQTLQLTSTKAPFSNGRGKVAIIGTFATPGIVCTNSYLSPHREGVGDHRFQVHDFDASLVLGTNYPKSIHPSGRALCCGVEWTVKKYNKVLRQMLIWHRAFEKMEYLQENHDNLTAAEFQLLFNLWDMEVTQLMLGLEKRCNKFRDGNIDFSPVVGLWIRHLQAYRWIDRYQNGQVPHAGNLYRLCRCLSVPSPSSLTVEEVIAAEVACVQKLADLKLQAPVLWNEHLHNCLDTARERGDKVATAAIIAILRTESTRQQWRTIQHTVNPSRGGAVTRLKVPDVAEDRVYATRSGVEEQAAQTIAARYKMARRAPIIQDPHFHQDFGFLANTKAAERVLAGTYKYLEGMDAHTCLLLEEAHSVFSSLLEEEVVDFVTTTDFESFW